MSAKKTTELRKKFEKQYGFIADNRDFEAMRKGELYKSLWRKYKKVVSK